MKAEAAGFDRLLVSDHVVLGENLDAYSRPELGGRRRGRQPTGPDGSFLDPLIVLSGAAGVTSAVRLGTHHPRGSRRPVVFAKQVATLDNLSNSPLDLGVGVGWQREEYQAAGLDFADRGKLLDHALEVCQTLWTQQSASHQSVWLRFANIHQMPKPRQDGGVPIWISGRPNRNVIGRLRRFGTGWLPWGMSHDELIDAIPEIRGEVSPIGGRRTPVAVAATVDVTFTADGQLDYHRAFDRVADLRAAGLGLSDTGGDRRRQIAPDARSRPYRRAG